MGETWCMTITEAGPHTRRAGILLHPTSLPGAGPNGTLGPAAHWFVDFLRSANASVWQVLPLSPPDGGASPYASRSAFAGGSHLIDESFDEGPADPADYKDFREMASFWLEDWALFEALRAQLDFVPWWTWPDDLRRRDTRALDRARVELRDNIERERQAQWRFWRQWQSVHRYANERGVDILGDIPIFVDHDSADAWAHQRLFKLTDAGELIVLAGVPPDMFSETGQRWGNPLFDWAAMEADGYRWWIERLRWSLRLFDSVRIDHFRGFAAAWEIPASSPTAMQGEWVPGPGKRLFDAIANAIGPIPMVAEDLGIITEDVTELRRSIGVPGMAVLQFGFGADAFNPYLPHNLGHDCVVYTGTHDNNTTKGWLATLDDRARMHLRDYAHREVDVREMVRMAYSSVAHTAIVPFQDVLELGAEARMNLPGTAEANWGWRFSWDQVTQEQADWLTGLANLYGRTNWPGSSR